MGIGAVAIAMLLVIPTGVERPSAYGEFHVKCLPMETVADIARSIVGPTSEISIAPGSKVLRFQGSPDDLNRLTDAIQSAEKMAASCTNPPPGR
jgi:hypothetical protein